MTVAGTLLLAVPLGGATGAGATTSSGPWTAALHLENGTPFELKLVDATKSEMTDWLGQPPPTVAPDEQETSVAQNTSFSFGHGLEQIVTYAMYAPGPDGQESYAGMFSISNGLECSTPALYLCLDYSGTQGAWCSPLVENATHWSNQVWIRWDNSSGPADHYLTDFALQLGSPQGNVACGKTRPGVQGAPSGQATAPDQSATTNSTPPSTASAPTTSPAPAAAQAAGSGAPGGLPGGWGWIQTVGNQTPYDLRLAWSWNSQGTDYLSVTPPAEIPPGRGTQYLYNNRVTAHGPQAFAAYNAYDPRDNKYIGSVVFGAQTDCWFAAKVPDIPATCVLFNTKNFSAADSVVEGDEGSANQVLQTEQSGGGVPPWSPEAHTLIHLGPAPRPVPHAANGGSSANTLQTTSVSVAVQPSTAAGPNGFALTASVKANGAAPPTGSVDFYAGHTWVGTTGLDGTGVATLTVQSLPSGHQTITGKYGGDEFSDASQGDTTVDVP